MAESTRRDASDHARADGTAGARTGDGTSGDQVPGDQVPDDQVPDDQVPDAHGPGATTPGAPAAGTEGPGAEAAGAPQDDSPLAVFPTDQRRRRWPRVLLTALGVLVLLVGGYAGAAWALGDRVPRGTTVAGVGVGGLPAGEAVRALEDGLAQVLGEPVPVSAGDRTASLDPVGSGLAVDIEATVDGLTGFTVAPQRLWPHLVGGGAERPVVRVDDAALTGALADLADALDTEPVDATVVFADGAAHTTRAVDGTAVDTEAAARLLPAEWLTGERPVDLPTDAVPPDITDDEAQTALRTLAQPFVGAPVVVAAGGQTVELPVDVLASVASVTARDSELTLTVDGPQLVEEVLVRSTDLLSTAADARFEFGPDGAPVLVPATAGTSLDPDALADAVVAAGTGEDRTAQVELVTSDPEQSTEELQALGITEVVSEFSTPLTAEPVRTGNLRVGAAKINGTLVRPGETFSLTEELGPITAEAGFRNATVIVDGEHVPGMGGGLSQIATTTYNAAFFAGFEDVEHQPHSEWFARYPEGRESTLYSGVIDMAFRNTTPYGALVQAWVGDGRVHVRIWGTKHWTVESSTSPRSDVVQPTTVRSSSPTCTPQSAGNPGFTVTVTRRLLLDGEVQERTSDTWRYRPQNAVVCVPEPEPEPEPDAP